MVTTWVCEVVKPCTICGIECMPGDRVVVRPGADKPISIVRYAVPNYGSVLGALDGEAITPLGDGRAVLVRELRRRTPPARGPLPRRRGALKVVK